ncbi:huntingtin isoform X1 [Brachionus plicatilis]|uniref:Huntingtin isoform X1 n=1 Tax=Brachionus plicatilis TaxID=10195 RepID=A0A3M7P1G1_BRAPC|nr:huntingtin isoform X1 [Brachionus plicatilis]
MTSVEKLTKSFEILKIPVQSYSDEQRKNDLKILNKKDKITHLNLVCENIVAQNVREAEHFSRNLGLAIETFLVFFDDEDRDVYFVAEECLNKIFKTFMDNYLIRFPADLYRFMKKNGPERSLKAALTRFAEICHFIKPQKCRIYVDFMIKDNILSKIAKRSEESIQSVLVDSMNRICATFCPSMTDQEIHLLIQSFLPNLSNNSSVNSYRRVSANCLSLICLYTASPLKSYHYLHGELLNLIHPIDENIEFGEFYYVFV